MSSGSLVVHCGRTARHTDVTKLIVNFRTFANEHNDCDDNDAAADDNSNNSRLTFRHRASSVKDRCFANLQRTLVMYLINKYISLSDICLTVHHWYK